MEAWQPGQSRSDRPGRNASAQAAQRTGKTTSVARRIQEIMASAVRGASPLWGLTDPDAMDRSDA
jgi:hypothetical protein